MSLKEWTDRPIPGSTYGTGTDPGFDNYCNLHLFYFQNDIYVVLLKLH